jgi:glycosyltransferase involved in cell wall biosynthesis
VVSEVTTPGRTRRVFVVITAARNEEAHIENTIRSVIAQTVLPLRWVIVSDGSTDRTDEIVRGYADTWPFIELLRVGTSHKHSFASKVYALNQGAHRLGQTAYEFIGHLDGDVSFGPSYFADLLERFDRDPSLGVAGGGIYEWDGSKYSPRRENSIRSVAGAVQMFRRQCYDPIGDFLPLEHGGSDWCAEVTARMKGWRVQSFPDLAVYHHHATRGWVGRLRRRYQEGLMDFSLGSHPLFEIAKLARRVWSRPYVLGAFVRLCAFAWAYCRREKRPVSEEFVKYLRREQLGRLWNFGRSLLPGYRPVGISP